jgi:hypothetical protein
MSEPTPPRGSEPQQPPTEREETRPFAAPVPPQQPTAADGAGIATPARPPAATTARTRRDTLLMGAAAVGLLSVGVVVGVVIGQATAGSAAAGTSSSTIQPGPGGSGFDGSGQYGTPSDGRMGGMPPGGRGGFGPQTLDGADDGTTGDDPTT